ncbi:MAG: hypothetical protein QHI48_02955 [Bacteroidota bacterium]|nr:hypothetical protein [Bacteroidota bacterium]
MKEEEIGTGRTSMSPATVVGIGIVPIPFAIPKSKFSHGNPYRITSLEPVKQRKGGSNARVEMPNSRKKGAVPCSTRHHVEDAAIYQRMHREVGDGYPFRKLPVLRKTSRHIHIPFLPAV